MDLMGVQLFVLAAEKLNISAAGKELGLAPSVASARLAKLETELGAELLHRSTRKVALSLEGAEFLPFAKEMVAQEAMARDALGQNTGEIRGTIRFAASSTFTQAYVAPLIPEFLALNPGINLDLRASDTQFDMLEGSFDLALRNMPLVDSSLKARKLANATRVLCASKSYIEANGMPQTPDDLQGHHLIAFGNRDQKVLLHRDGTRASFDTSGSNCRLVIDDGFSMKRALMFGAGISINSIWSVHANLKNGSLVHVLPDWEIEDQSAIWLVYPKTNVLTAKVRVLIDFLVAKIGTNPPWER